MERALDSLIEALILPPGFILIMLVIGILLIGWRPLLGRSLLILGLVSLYWLSTPWAAAWLMRHLEIYPVLSAAEIEAAPARAIVVLSAGRDRQAAEYGGDTVGPNTLVRCRYAARLHRQSGLPVLASGGIPGNAAASLAQMMSDVMMGELAVQEVWIEGRSRNTHENARFSAAMLRERQIDTIFLVSQGWHLRRAVAQFEAQGLRVIPAPTALRGEGGNSEQAGLNSWLPRATALVNSYAALREYGGLLWYRIRY